MRKIVSFFLSLFVLNSFAQTFNTDNLKSDISALNACVAKKESVLASNIFNLNKRDDSGAIKYQYVFNSDSPISTEKVLEITRKWFNEDPNNRTMVSVDSESLQVTGTCGLGVVAFEVDSKSDVDYKVLASPIITIGIKENRIRVTVLLEKYDYFINKYAINTEWAYVHRVSPYEDNGHAKTYTKAYINANNRCINLVVKYINYLNDNYNKPILETEKEDEW